MIDYILLQKKPKHNKLKLVITNINLRKIYRLLITVLTSYPYIRSKLTNKQLLNKPIYSPARLCICVFHPLC